MDDPIREVKIVLTPSQTLQILLRRMRENYTIHEDSAELLERYFCPLLEELQASRAALRAVKRVVRDFGE